MKFSSALFAVLATASMSALPAFADDLPDNTVITNTYSGVGVYNVKDAKITKEKVTRSSSPTLGRIDDFTVVVEVSLDVEGNICDSKPETIAAHITSTPPKWETNVNFYTTSENDPYEDVIRGCLAYGRVTPVKYPIKIYSSAWKAKPYKQVFNIMGNASNSGTRTAAVEFTYTIEKGPVVKLKK